MCSKKSDKTHGQTVWKRISNHRKRIQELFHTREDHALNIKMSQHSSLPYWIENIVIVQIMFWSLID